MDDVLSLPPYILPYSAQNMSQQTSPSSPSSKGSVAEETMDAPSKDETANGSRPPSGDGAAKDHSIGIQSGRTEAKQYVLDESDLVTDERTNADIFETEISEEVYQQNYRYGADARVPHTWYRNARALASIEDDTEAWTQRFYQLLSGQGLGTGPFPFTPGARCRCSTSGISRPPPSSPAPA